MAEVSDPWDALDVLEDFALAHRPDFVASWRAFLRDCALLLLPSLPLDASVWFAAADEFEAGRLSADQLTAARVKAWRFLDTHRDTHSSAVQEGLQAVMARMWPEVAPDHWYDTAWHFLHSCKEAGLPEDKQWPLLQTRLGGFLNRPA